MTRPRFSIITITRNNLDGLKRTRESLPAGGYEWIVIDGASPDGTAEYLAQSGAEWISEPDQGIYDAMNKGISRASGEFILFLNAGDALCDKNILQKISDSLADPLPDFIYGDSLENGAYKKARAHTKSMRGMFTHHQAMFYRREKIGALRYDTSYRIAADYDFTLRFLGRAEDILYCMFPFCDFESGGISQQMVRLGRREQYVIRQKAGINILINSAIYAMQSVSWTLRQVFPRLYWRLKAPLQPSGNKPRARGQKPTRPAHP